MSHQLPRNSTAPLSVCDGKPPLIDRLQDAADVEDDGEVIYLGERRAPQASVDRALDNLVEFDAHLDRNHGQDTDVEAAPEDTLVLRMFSDNFQRLLANPPPMDPEHLAAWIGWHDSLVSSYVSGCRLPALCRVRFSAEHVDRRGSGLRRASWLVPA